MMLLKLLPVLISLFCIAAALIPVRRGKIAHPCYTEGLIVGHRTQMVYKYRNETMAFAPVVRYMAQDKEITAVSRYYVPEWQYGHRTGERVKICYNAQQPDLFRICRDGGEWRRGVLLTIGIGTLLAYGILWIQYY